MSFLGIKDPDERDEQIAKYLALKQRLKERDLEERGDYMDRRRKLQGNFEPVVSSNQKMAEDITSELKEIRQNIALKSEKRIKNEVHGPLAEEFLQNCMDLRKGTDTTFGIRYESGIPMIGNKEIKIDGDDIIVDVSIYHGTSGLWSLVTDKDPDGYDEIDYRWCTDLPHQTDALYQGFDRHTRYPRASRSKKWTKILRPIWNEIQLTDLNIVYTDDSGDNVEYCDPTPWNVESEKTK